jgi:hypothetical protein
MIWKIEEAQQQFSEIIEASGATPSSDLSKLPIVKGKIINDNNY